MDNFNETKGLQEFFYDGRQVRIVQKDGEPWWVLKDVCDILGLSNPTVIAERLDEDEKAKLNLGFHETNLVNESGLYRVIMRSDKPNAKPFTRWVTHDVLPQIRKHGAYVTSSKIDEILNDPEAWIKLLTSVKEERLAKERLQVQIEHDKPKIIFADAVSVSNTDILIGELAKILRGNGIKIGQNRLFEHLRQDGFLVRRNGSDYNTPTQKSMELGLFRIIETAITHSDGRITISKTTKVTGKGQLYFVNMFLNGNKSNHQINEASTTEIIENDFNLIEVNHGF
jgi:anti-repressor protein